MAIPGYRGARIRWPLSNAGARTQPTVARAAARPGATPRARARPSAVSCSPPTTRSWARFLVSPLPRAAYAGSRCSVSTPSCSPRPSGAQAAFHPASTLDRVQIGAAFINSIAKRVLPPRRRPQAVTIAIRWGGVCTEDVTRPCPNTLTTLHP